MINIVLMDVSQSMLYKFGNSLDKRSKLDVAKDVLIKELAFFFGSEFCLITFNDTPNFTYKGIPSNEEFEYIKAKIVNLLANGSTNIGKALLFCKDIIDFSRYDLVNITIITDGEDNDLQAIQVAEQIASGFNNIAISTILIEPEPVGLELAKKISINGQVRTVSNSKEFEEEMKKLLEEKNIKHSIRLSKQTILRIDQQKLLLEKEMNLLIQQLENYDANVENSKLSIPVKFKFISTQDSELTSKLLETKIIPFLKGLEQFQLVLNEITQSSNPIKIVYISKFSPVEVSVEGIAKAFEIFERILMPWKRKHAQEMARVEEEVKKLEVSKL